MIHSATITDADDRTLLRQYAAAACAASFTELVRRHVSPVYLAALRRVNGDHALAEDVVQTVFADFARKAAGISADTPPGGWLHRHTGFVASKMTSRERQRRRREEQAMNSTDTTTAAPGDTDWAACAPLLDAALDTLPGSDRDAIVLRYIEQKDYHAVGAALGMSDDSAQKKVSRALERLRSALERRGILSTGGALAAMLVTGMAGTAPAGFAQGLAVRSLAAGARAGGTLGGAVAGMSAAARWQAAAAVAALITAAGIAGTMIVRSQPPSPVMHVAGPSTELAVKPAPQAASTASPVKPAEAQEDAAALVAAAAAEWRGGEGVAQSARALTFLSRIRVEDMRAALAQAAAAQDERVRGLLTSNLVSLWAEQSPREALEWTTTEAPEARRAELRLGILDAWAAKNPDAVMGWGGKTSTRTLRPDDFQIVTTAFRTLARRDAAEAFQRIRDLQNPAEQEQALRGILENVRTPEDRERISKLAAAMPEADLRIRARRAIIEHWARQSPQQAAAAVENAEPAWERTRLMDSLGLIWLQRDPSAAAQWWTQHVPGPDTLVKIINVWAQQDPDAAGRWLNQQPAGPLSDTARMTFARQVADIDPESALRWADTVSDSATSEAALTHIFRNWHSRDAAAAGAFLKRSGWPQDRISKLHEP